jgi:hypothetical protein
MNFRKVCAGNGADLLVTNDPNLSQKVEILNEAQSILVEWRAEYEKTMTEFKKSSNL